MPNRVFYPLFLRTMEDSLASWKTYLIGSDDYRDLLFWDTDNVR